MAQQTAVEWFIYKLNGCDSTVNDFIFNGVITSELIEEIKQMEKEQIKKSWFDSTLQFDNAASMVDKKEFEQYYNETYGTE